MASSRIMLHDTKEQGHQHIPSVTRRPSLTALQRHVPSPLRHLLTAICLFGSGLLLGMHYPFFLSVYTRRPDYDLVSLLPRRLPPLPETMIPPIAGLPAPQPEIPNIVHYVYGLKPPSGSSEKGPEFPYFAYIGMRSAMTVLKPEKIMFHCRYEPTGYWWDQVLNWEGWIDERDGGKRKGLVQVVRVRDVEYIGTQQRPVTHYAHKADILRLEILQEHGGIYLDIDTIILKPFREASIMMQDTVLGMEAKHLSITHGKASDDEMDPKGLCNAIIVARPQSVFVKRWLDSYEEFDNRQWADHSVRIPWALAQLYPTTVTVLSERAFFWPMWSPDHIDAVYVKSTYNFESSGQLAYHLWESMAKRHLAALNPTTIQSHNTSFTRMASRFMAADEEARWRRHLEGSKENLLKSLPTSRRPTFVY